MKERLQKFLASAGIASRRHAEELIVKGLVAVNGKIVKQLGTTIDPERDRVTFRGKPVEQATTSRYIALNKPRGYVSTRAKHPNEKTVYDLVPSSRRLVIAGRLDKDSEGLVLLTNDGELVNTITHPRYQHDKEYIVETIKSLDANALNKFKRGVRLEEGTATVDVIEEIAQSTYRIVIHQGWKRQIRRMIAAVRNDVVSLRRVRIAKLEIGTLRVGGWKEVRRSEIL